MTAATFLTAAADGFHILGPVGQEMLATVCGGRKSTQLGMLGFKEFCTEIA